jgi:hypothetical protein
MASMKRPAISRKPAAGAHADEEAIAAFISKGGSFPHDPPLDDERTEARINFRLPGDMLAEVDAVIKQRRIRISRNTWLLEAVQEKLDREAGQAS